MAVQCINAKMTQCINAFELNLNLPDTPYTSGKVLHDGVRVENGKKEKKKKKVRRGEAIVIFRICRI